MWSATALLVIATAGFFVLHSSLLAVRVVKVIGAVHTPVAQIEAVAGVASHPPLIDVDPGTLSARLERLPWVATAAVDREWPDGLRIEVTERVPVAVIRVEAAPPSAKTTVTAPPAPWALVDRTGRVLADVASPPAGVVPVSAAVSPGRPGTDVGAGAQPGIEVAASLPRAFSSQVTAVTVAGSGTVTLSMTTPITVDLGNTSELREKYEDVAAILAGAKLSSGDVIDVSVPDAPVVRRG
jgi:cell division protein FtsQ